jgi:hypothetical protein
LARVGGLFPSLSLLSVGVFKFHVEMFLIVELMLLGQLVVSMRIASAPNARQSSQLGAILAIEDAAILMAAIVAHVATRS